MNKSYIFVGYCGRCVLASLLKPTMFIYLAFKGIRINDPFIYILVFDCTKYSLVEELYIKLHATDSDNM